MWPSAAGVSFAPGAVVTLRACWTGYSKNSVAQSLATALGVTVKAPRGDYKIGILGQRDEVEWAYFK